MSSRTFVGALLLICAVVVVGRSVDPAAVKTFQAGTPALASDMNGNFQELIDAINDNSARIENLERGSVGCTVEEIVAGSTYKILGTPVVLGTGSTISNTWIELALISDQYTFNEDGTVTGESSSNLFAITNTGGDSFVGEFPEGPDAESGTWEVVDGEVLMTLDLGGSSIKITPTVDGNSAFFILEEDLRGAPDGDKPPLAPDDRRLLGLIVAVKVPRMPVIDRIVRTDLTATEFTVEVVLKDKGSGLPLEFGFLDRRVSGGPGVDGKPPEQTVWNRTGVFTTTLWPNKPPGEPFGWFFARRGCNDDFVSDPFKALGVSIE